MRLILTRATRKSASAVCLLSFHTSEEPKNKFDGAHRNPRAPVLFPFFSFFVKVHEVLVGESFPVILSRCFLSICQMSTVRPLRNPIIIIHGFGASFFFSFSFFFFFNNSNHSPGRRQGKMRWESVQQAAAFAQCHVNTPSPGWERKKNPCDIPPESPLTPKQSVEL